MSDNCIPDTTSQIIQHSISGGMMTKIAGIFALLAVVGLSVSSAEGALIFNNGEAAEPGHDGAISDPDGGFVAADNFSLGLPANLTGVRWWGGFDSIGTGGSFPSTSYSVTIYTDSGAGPSDTVLHTSALTLTSPPTEVGAASFLGLAVFDINATLDDDIILATGTTYWLSIVNAADSASRGFWATSSSAPLTAQDGHSDDVPGTFPWTDTNEEFAFQLFGDEMVAVPEPSSLALLGMGAFAFVGYGLRRRKQTEVVQS